MVDEEHDVCFQVHFLVYNSVVYSGMKHVQSKKKIWTNLVYVS